LWRSYERGGREEDKKKKEKKRKEDKENLGESKESGTMAKDI
jgi:hypothetical protein